MIASTRADPLPDPVPPVPELARRAAIIDIGSNSIRLVVYERTNRSPLPVFNEKVLCGLAREIDVSGQLHAAGRRLALDNLERFVALTGRMNVGSLDLLATAAVRDAADGAAFVAEIRRRTGREVRVIDGQEEAHFSGLGVLCAMPEAEGVMGDLGGGSLELVALADGALAHSTTLPVGPLRLLSSGRDARAAVTTAIAGVDWLRGYGGRNFYPVGGAWRAFARLHMEQVGHPLHIIHQYAIAGGEARELAQIVASQSPRSLEKMPGVSRRRLESLPLAALALERLLAALKPKRVIFSAFGLREGYFFSRLPAAERARHPLIAFAEDEGAGWRRFDLSPLEIFDWLSPAFAGDSDGQRILRLAACHLSDIAWDDHPDYRAEQAYARTLHLPAPGMDHVERAILALAMYWRYKSDPRSATVATAQRLANAEQRNFARRLGTCLRLAYNLSGGAPGLLPLIALKRSGRALQLEVPAALRNQLGDVTERRLAAAAEAFDLKPAIDLLG